jgi:hypothetical protein
MPVGGFCSAPSIAWVKPNSSALREGNLGSHPSICESITAVTAALEAQIETVRMLISKTIDDDPDLKQRQDLLETIPGLGPATIACCLCWQARALRDGQLLGRLTRA